MSSMMPLLGWKSPTTASFQLIFVAHIKQLSVENYVRLRDVKDARDVMHEYDALVVPSFQESQPHAALVAMTMGGPIIGSRAGGMSDA